MSSRQPAPLRSPSGLVRATPPTGPGRYWRLSVLDDAGRRVAQTTGGRSLTAAQERLAELERQCTSAQPAARRAQDVGDLLDFFLSPTRPKVVSSRRRPDWSPSYTEWVTQLVHRDLRPVLADVPLGRLDSTHLYRVLDCTTTDTRLRQVRAVASAVLHVGVANGFLRPDQGELHRVGVPLRRDLRPPRAGSDPGRREDRAALPAALVPSTAQVQALAASTPDGATGQPAVDWAGCCYLAAYAGLRIGELLASTADDLGPNGQALLAVPRQVVETRTGKLLTPPKSGWSRLAPLCARTPQGFPLHAWVIDRAVQARAEQRSGHNRLALLVPSPTGTWWSQSNFRSRRFLPAALAAGWQQLHWPGTVRRRIDGRWQHVAVERHELRHTWHSLRHHYAVTARDAWGWTGAELCAAGGWADPGFVFTRYYGATDEVYRTAIAKQERAAEQERNS